MGFSMPRALLRFAVCSSLLAVLIGQPSAPKGEEVRAAMKRATDFMMNQVSTRGGFLWHYSEDLSKAWGELPARRSQVWIQPPSTPTVGRMLLAAYEVTRDDYYLQRAKKVADVLIFGQHPSGGWHYFIDFQMDGVAEWYQREASKWRGWEEFYHYYGNATFDDDTTASPTKFLLDLYLITLEPEYRRPLLKALDFVLESQYPNGSWPQRYPLSREFPHQGRADYTSAYTFNDDVTSNNIYLLSEAYRGLGSEHYQRAARRGMDFYILSQLPAPQAGWALQYDSEMRPVGGRTYEPAGLCVDQTISNLEDLKNFYRISGDRRYLEPIAKAIRWLKDSAIHNDRIKGFSHANFYEIGSNQPLVIHHDHRTRPDGRFEIVRYRVDSSLPEEVVVEAEMPTSDDETATGYHLAAEFQDSHFKSFSPNSVDTEQMLQELREYQELSLEELRSWYGDGTERPLRFSDRRRLSTAGPVELEQLIRSLDPRGAWITTVEFLDQFDFTHNPPNRFRGIDTGTYVSNMYKFINYLKTQKNRQ